MECQPFCVSICQSEKKPGPHDEYYPEAMSEVAFFSVSEYVLKILLKKKEKMGPFFFLLPNPSNI